MVVARMSDRKTLKRSNQISDLVYGNVTDLQGKYTKEEQVLGRGR